MPWKELINNYDVIFVSGNPRVISDLVFATYLRIFKKNVVLWTMAHSSGANKVTENLRLLWSRIFKKIFVYTDAEVNYLRNRGFKNNFILGMNNGLDQQSIDAAILLWPKEKLSSWLETKNLANNTLLLSCARLDAKNKFEDVIKALPIIIKQVPNVIWCTIGTGPEEEKLKMMVQSAGLEKYVIFAGEIYEQKKIAPWFLTSELFIHPSSIGLSLLHAFGYGLPVITHNNALFHFPEYAAFEPELTGRTFDEDNILQLANTILDLIKDRKDRERMKLYVQEVARKKYNVDIMVERFTTIARKNISKI